MAPLTMWEEKNTGSNLPAQIELYATDGGAYKFLFMAKGGGSANKSFLYQETKAVLNEASMMKFLEAKIRSLGTAACPPYHLAIVVGGTSAEYALKTAKYASAHYLDELPAEGSALGNGFRDKDLEQKVFELTQKIGIGAQFGGKYFCHDVRVVRLPRHGASCPVAIAVSCSADRQALAKITPEGVFLEQLETDPARFLPETTDEHLDETDVVRIDLNRPMDDILAELTKYPVKTRLSLTGPLVVARDIAHAKIKERLDAGDGMPQYLKDHPVYYAGPAKTPEGYASGSFGPTTAGRMDSYVDQFQAASRSPTPAPPTAASTSAPSAAPPPASPRTASRRSRSSNTPNSAWKPSGASRSRTSPPSSSSTTRATTSSPTPPRRRPPSQASRSGRGRDRAWCGDPLAGTPHGVPHRLR
jgi:fumarate hydratase class I